MNAHWLCIGVLWCCALTVHTAHPAHAAPAAPKAVPEASLLDQDGRQVAFHRDLVKDKTVIVNFIFTSCTMICPTQAATMREVQKSLGARVGRDIALISISIDPAVDVPARLKAFSERFEAEPGWHFVTGRKPEVDTLLAALGAGGAAPAEHSGLVLVINDSIGSWTRLEGLASAPEIVRAAHKAAGPVKTGRDVAATYFTNLPLLTQDGQAVRFYDDMLKDKVVLINFMFTTCPGICTPMTANLARVQALLGERSGQAVHMVSITVDPGTDTPTVLRDFARRFQIKPGWTFLTGKKENVDWVRYKLGGYNGEQIDDHSTILLAGNLRTGEWKKLMALGAAAHIVAAVVPMLTAQP